MPKRKNKAIKEYTLKNGEKRYMFKIFLGRNINRIKKETTRRGFKSFAEAEEAYNHLNIENVNDFVKQKQITINQMYEIWFARYRTTVKESTANKTAINYRVHIKPFFGNAYMDKISVRDVQLWADKLATKLVKFNDPIFILRSFYEYAIRMNYVSINPVGSIIMPVKTSRPRRNVEDNVYSRKELELFLQVAKEYNLRAYTYFKLLASTGLRKSEALALTWSDIDFINGVIDVNKTLAVGLDNKVQVQPPKSKSSIRQVPISANLANVLNEYKNSEKILSAKVFHTYTGKYLSLSKPMKWLEAIYNKAPKDLKHITVHGFRHTFATLLISETNVKPKTVQMLLGHSNIQMTLDIYTHINNKNKKEAVNVLNELDI
ncbi:tyrosine-type recombinase/integrase [Lactobacillus mulieris]|jgi:lj965 prophage integrase|uniref:Site-specific integrase n=2 Tax=root TaxID=1 RepID=A0AAW5WWM1_9LACO|nr:site-specific integrase [Lactobacillus mulieris]EEU21658.1 hypothetical protein HMPREF0525_00592 [Lactobacillus jensenii 27-2-CHN]EEX24526.1 site-specific recombinase, phage integrase family [Lactobacillus jensenii 115-3-CHN]KAA9372707.1 site-specific integrase [Lactobacillus jensenii]DAD80331.1 MAG TPA: Integrase [Siphoviridae sp. ctX581]MCW8093488.1 site-specific integrase [Lactobacillus mulieris]